MRCGANLGIESTVGLKASPTDDIDNQVDYSASGVIIINMLNSKGGSFRARALLDSGSGTNFVEDDVLAQLEHRIISSEDVTIAGINTTETRINMRTTAQI